MIILNIPGYESINIKNIVFDFNGTIAKDGILIEEVKEKIKTLASKDVNIFVITADTYGTVLKQCIELPVKVEVFSKENPTEDKKQIVEKLGHDVTVTFGNGRNDIEMFKSSVISIAIIGEEGCYSNTILEADIVVNNIVNAIDLLLKPDRIKATMRT